jgi:hypothetical protein
MEFSAILEIAFISPTTIYKWRTTTVSSQITQTKWHKDKYKELES